MNNKTKKVLVIIFIILITMIVVLRFGSYVSHRINVQGKFVSKVGKDTYVFDLSNGDSGSVEAEYLWHSLLRGAPRPFQLIGMYTIKRIEIVDSDFDIHKRCGSFHINVYTSFNFQKFNNLRVNEPCP